MASTQTDGGASDRSDAEKIDLQKNVQLSAKLSELSSQLAVEAGQRTFPHWSDDRIVDWLLFRLKLPLALVPLAFAGFYWVLPLALSAIDGTLLRSASAASFVNLLRQSGMPQSGVDLAQRFADYQKLLDADALPYLQDATHFVFALILSVGALVAVITVRNFDTAVSKLSKEGIPSADVETIDGIYRQYRHKAFRKRYSYLFAALGLAALLLFLHLSHSPQFKFWWGSSDFGVAGLVFAFVVGAMVFGVLQGAAILIFGALMLARLMSLPIELKPFHRDGCNGLAPLGRQIFLLWWNALLGGLAIYVALRLGYLGVERTPVVWVLAVLGTLTIPTIAIIPLLASLNAVRKVQNNALDRLGVFLNQNLGAADAAIQRGDLSEANRIISQLSEVKDLFEIFKAANVWPFNPKALTFIVVANLVQIALTAHELVGLIWR